MQQRKFVESVLWHDNKNRDSAELYEITLQLLNRLQCTALLKLTQNLAKNHEPKRRYRK